VKRAIAVAAALAALLIAVPAASARSVPQGFFGVMYDHGIERASDGVQDEQWDLMASSGVETVRTHARSIYRKLGVPSRRELARMAQREAVAVDEDRRPVETA